jgi:hypothetical protein
MKHYYAVESIGINANTNRRHCARYVRFPTLTQRDEWVAAKQERTPIHATDADMTHELRDSDCGWTDDDNGGEWLV